MAGDANHTDTDVTAIDGNSKTIGQKALTITANEQIIAYGESIADDAGQVTSDGLVDGDEITSVVLIASTEDVTTDGIITPSEATTTNGIDNYSVTYNTGTLTITASAASVTTAPAYVEDALTYTGDAQELVTAGDGVIGGTLKYYVSMTDSEPATTDEGWTATVPTGTDVGTYYVWYYVDGDANHTSTAVTAIEGGKAIGKADPTLSATEISFEALGTSTGSKTVTVCDNTGEISATVTSGATNCRVSVSGTTITITRLTEAAFNATITVTIAESENYNSATKTISVSGTTASSFPMANAAISDHIGHVICSNGHIHVTVGAATSAGCTASAMIA